MVTASKGTGDVVISRDLADKLVQGFDSIGAILAELDATLTALIDGEPNVDAAAAADTVASAHGFDTSPAALENADAETLVALRKDHAAVEHDAATCYTCAVLERRLGSAKP